MNLRIWGVSLSISLALCSSAAYANCESGEWIESVIDDGRILKLGDGSIWEVDSTDTITSALWLPMTDVLVCDDDKIISTDDEESVEVKRIR
jgi:hypothetical protein